MERKTISVKTSLGELTAEIGGDPYEYPEIFVYLKREDGVEIDLVCASMNITNNEMAAYLYGDTSTDCWTKKHTWTAEELNVEVE